MVINSVNIQPNSIWSAGDYKDECESCESREYHGQERNVCCMPVNCSQADVPFFFL